MPGTDSVPAIRFKGFTDPWEQRKLDEFDIKTGPFGSMLHADDYVSCGTPIVTTEHFKSGDLPFAGSGIPQVSDFDKGRLGQYSLQEHDIVFSRVGSVDLNAEVKSAQVGWLFSGRVLRVRPNESIDSSYLHYELSTDEVRRSITERAVGLTMASINTVILGETSFVAPSKLAEQRQIGAFFQQLDNLITLHQRKHDKLTTFKKSMLDKMFPKDGADVPEIRFAGFTDPWEQRKWSDTVTISTDMVDPKSGEYDDLVHIGPGNIESFTGRLYNNVNTVREDRLISGKFHFYSGDIIYGKINPQLGKYTYAQVEGLASADAYVLNAQDGLDQKFLFAILQTEDFFKYSTSVSMRSGMPKINRDELAAYEYLAPEKLEQIQIGLFFMDIDNFITLHQRQSDSLKKIKRSCLEKMFV